GTGQSIRYSQDRLRDVTSKVRAKLRADEEDFGEYAHMLSTLQQQLVAHETVVSSNAATNSEQSTQPVGQSIEPNSVTVTAPPLNDTDPKYPPPVLSKFEQYMHEKYEAC